MEDKKSHWLVRAAGPAALFVLALLLYLPSLRAPFTYDDVLVSIENPNLSTASNVFRYFDSDVNWLAPEELSSHGTTRSASGLYRPLLAASYHLDYALFGLNPKGWRLISVILHGITGVLVFFLAFRLLGSRTAALIAGAVFSAHPAHVEAVLSLLGGRAELLSGLFVILGWLSFLRSLESGKKSVRVCLSLLSALLLLLGLFSKENAVILPGLAFISAWSILGKPAKTALLPLVPQLVTLIAYAILRLWVVGRLEAQDWSYVFGDLAGWKIIFSCMAILARYVLMVIAPFSLIHPDCFFDFPSQVSVAMYVGACVLVVGLLGAALYFLLRARWNNRTNIFCASLLMFFVCLIPVSHIVPFAVVMAQRFLFLPSVAFSLATGWLWLRYCQRRHLLILVPTLLVLLFSVTTVVFNIRVREPESMYKIIMDCRPQSVTSYNNLGTYKLRKGQVHEALELFEEALRINPLDPSLLYNKGLCLQKLGQNVNAEYLYRQVLEIMPEHKMAPNNLGVLLSARGRFQEAEHYFEQAMRNDPAHPEPVVNLAILKEQEGKLPEAKRLYLLALKMDPRLETARQALERLEKDSLPP